MKKLSIITILLLLIASVLWAADTTYGPKVYRTDGGDKQVIASGGTMAVESGGIVDVESGGYLKLAGTAVTSTAAELNKLASIGAGDVVTTTNTKTLTNKTLSGTTTLSGATLSGGATLVGTYAGGTFDSQTINGPVYSVSSKTFTAGEDWELSASEAKSLLLTASSGSGTPSIIAPSTSGKVYFFRNGAGVAIMLKRSGGTGISVASGNTASLIDNGSDYVRVTADGTH